MFQSIFYSLSSLITVYSFICLLRILMSWMPQLEYTAPGRFIAGLCDPYLNWFRRFSFTRMGMVDFSPILALGVLSVASMVFSTLGATGKISLGIILGGLLQVVWSFFSFFLTILIVFLVIRLIYDFMHRYSYSQFWTMLDKFLNPPISRVTQFFMRGKTLGYRASLILTLVTMIVLRAGLEFLIRYIMALLYLLPI